MKKLILGLSILLASCHSNVSFVDINSNSLIVCDNTRITKVLIEGTNGNNDFYLCRIKDDSININSFNLSKISNNYLIKDNLDNDVVNLDYILKPSSRYKISNLSNGDAAISSIIIDTDAKGNIYKTSKSSCD